MKGFENRVRILVFILELFILFMSGLFCREAVQHFLTALNTQRMGRGPRGEVGQMSDSIWSTLRMATSFLKEDEAYEMANHKDLDGLSKKFGVEEKI